MTGTGEELKQNIQSIPQFKARRSMTFAKSIRTVLQRFPLPLRSGIRKTIAQLPFGSTVLYKYHQNSLDAYILSFPKCGRTWLRMILGKALQIHFGLKENNFLGSNYLIPPAPGIPVVKVTHDDNPQLRTPDELITDKAMYKGVKVILLVRDLRDVVVSCYFHANYRTKTYNGDLSTFVTCSGRTERFLSFYNIWAENRHVPEDFLLVRYEDIHSSPEKQLSRVLRFLDLNEVSESIVRDAVEFGTFKRMRQMELNDVAGKTGKLRARDKNDPRSYKTRRGSVGGFVDYLSQADIEYLNRKIKKELSSFYGYGHPEPRPGSERLDARGVNEGNSHRARQCSS